MSRTYTNRNHEKVVVSDEHLATAIAIKEELQKASPSNRISWKKHKAMMETEGFMNSDVNENYRCLIKDVQKKAGVLPTATKHADMVADKKLKSIQEEIGELNYAKFTAQQARRELNKTKRDVSKGLSLIEDIKESLNDLTFEKPKQFKGTDEDEGSKELIVCLSDIHYGADFVIPQNSYNPQTTQLLFKKYASNLRDIIREDGNITKVNVVNLGDSIEHAQMRSQNTFEVQKTLAEQISEVSNMIWNFLAEISQEVEEVTYQGIAGNHDRLNGNYKSALTGDSASTLINNTIRALSEVADGNIKYIEAYDPYFTCLEVKGRNFAFVHGDKHKLHSDRKVLSDLSYLYGKEFVGVFGGHIHHNECNEVGDDVYQINFGSFKGTDPFGVSSGFTSSRSQGVIIVQDNSNYNFTYGIMKL